MARRETSERYAAHVLGAAWSVAHPLILMSVYVFIFGFVFKARVDAGMPLDYMVYILFPIEVLPAKTVLATLLPQVVQIVMLMVYVVVRHGQLPATYALAPVLIVLQTLAILGIGYALSSVAVYFRDLKDIVQVFTMVGIYLMPVFYLPNMVPAMARPLLYLNPFSYVIWAYQDALYFGRIAHPVAWVVLAAGSVLSLYIGSRIFASLKPHFGNVL
jgi:lipopolysaccharide transport system permease protein